MVARIFSRKATRVAKQRQLADSDVYGSAAVDNMWKDLQGRRAQVVVKKVEGGVEGQTKIVAAGKQRSEPNDDTYPWDDVLPTAELETDSDEPQVVEHPNKKRAKAKGKAKAKPAPKSTKVDLGPSASARAFSPRDSSTANREQKKVFPSQQVRAIATIEALLADGEDLLRKARDEQGLKAMTSAAVGATAKRITAKLKRDDMRYTLAANNTRTKYGVVEQLDAIGSAIMERGDDTLEKLCLLDELLQSRNAPDDIYLEYNPGYLLEVHQDLRGGANGRTRKHSRLGSASPS